MCCSNACLIFAASHSYRHRASFEACTTREHEAFHTSSMTHSPKAAVSALQLQNHIFSNQLGSTVVLFVSQTDQG